MSPAREAEVEPGVEPEDESEDDALIAALQARAWDPGRRFDTAAVPVEWITGRYGEERMERLRERRDIVSSCSDGTVEVRSQAAEVAAYYADAPRGPQFPPVTDVAVDEAERRIGYRLPALLRRVYTEVGDGGFGPDGGLASLREGNGALRHRLAWPCSVRIHEDNRERERREPTSWLLLAYGGCSMQWHVSLLAVDSPVLLYDSDGWEPSWGQDAHDGLRHATTLRQWLRTWADGGNVWDPALAAEA